MKPDVNLEAKIVRTLAKFLADERSGLQRWRTIGRAWTFSGAVLWVVAIFGHLQDTGGHWMLAVLAAAGGVCLGLGLWFSTFVEQWPAVRQFIDAERVRQRSIELEAQVPKEL